MAPTYSGRFRCPCICRIAFISPIGAAWMERKFEGEAGSGVGSTPSDATRPT